MAAVRKFFLDKLLAKMQHEPNAIFCHYYPSAHKEQSITFGELAALVQPRAQILADKLALGDLFFIVHSDVLEQIICWLAAIVAGVVPGILTPPTSKLDRKKYFEELQQTLGHYQNAQVYFETSLSHLPEALGIEKNVFHFGDIAAAAEASKTLAFRSRASESPFIFQQSSGTTGLRKGILLSEQSVINQLEAYGQAIGLQQQDKIISWLPLYHDMGLIACLAQAVYNALPLIITSPFAWLSDAEWLLRGIAEHQATLCWLPNFAFNFMAERCEPAKFSLQTLKSLRLVVNCSEPVMYSSYQAFEKRFAAIGLKKGCVSSCYAMAENTFAVTQTPPGQEICVETVDRAVLEKDQQAVVVESGFALASSGKRLPQVEIAIRHDGKICSAGQVGEIWVSSDCLMSGYFGSGGEQKPYDADGWYNTGDLGYLRGEELFVIGRKKDLIIRAGRNIDPTVLETVVSAGVKDVKSGRVVAFGQFNEKEGTEDIIVIAEFGGERVGDLDEVKKDVYQILNSTLDVAPQRVEIVRPEWLVKSSSGKIARKACAEKYAQMREQRQRGEIIALAYGDMDDGLKDAFAAFGGNSRIRTPSEIGAPGRIHIGNWVSLGRYGKLLMQTDFSSSIDYIKQHYPHVHVDFAKMDPRIFGKRDPYLKIGDGSSIGDYFFISTALSIVIGKHVMMSARVFITDSNHLYEHPDLPIALQSNTLGQPVVIGDHSWIGIGASILEGATIGKHCVVSSNSVVNFAVPDYAVVAGNPARIVRILPHGDKNNLQQLPTNADAPVAAGKADIIAVLCDYFSKTLSMPVQPNASLIRSGLVDSIGSLSMIQHLEDTLNIKINELQFFTKKPDCIEEMATVLTS